jgi:capsular polysaccharide biosynthesis protein
MEEINLKDLYDYFMGRIFFIITGIIIIVFIGTTYAMFFQKPKYNAATTLVLTHISETEKNNAITQNDILLNQKLVSTYREIITSRSILKSVINDLDLNMTPEELSKGIQVSSVKDTELIKISVSNDSGEVAANIANALAITFSERILEIYSIKNISIIDRAEIPVKPYNINTVLQFTIYLLLGIVISCGVVFMIYYFDNTLKDEAEIEKQFGLFVLGIVPTIKESRGN